MRGFQPKHFSFNVDGGRCDTCKGEGEQVVEMQFLADVHLTCEVCGGKRFKEEVLEVKYKDKNIFDVLEMSVDEAIDFFKDEKDIVKSNSTFEDVGLGYIKLGPIIRYTYRRRSATCKAGFFSWKRKRSKGQ